MTASQKAVTATAGFRWRAPQPDGVGHLYPSRSLRAALCGAPNQDERFDHPRGRRCPDCEGKAAKP